MLVTTAQDMSLGATDILEGGHALIAGLRTSHLKRPSPSQGYHGSSSPLRWADLPPATSETRCQSGVVPTRKQANG